VTRPVPPLLVTLDPGRDGSGVAVFVEGRFVEAAYVPHDVGNLEGAVAWWRAACAISTWVHVRARLESPHDAGSVFLTETMRTYTGASGAANPADLLHLEGVAATCVGVFGALGFEVESALARTWNGNVPRKIRMARTRAWLEASEPGSSGGGPSARVRCPPGVAPGLVHNAWSAVGIGRWRLTGCA
jgi:hypothetical protein